MSEAASDVARPEASSTVPLNGLTVGPFQSNCYILGPTAGGSLVVVDPGDEASRIEGAIDAIDGALAAILLTHAHLDHVGAVAALKRRWDVPVWLHPDDLPLHRRAAELGAAYGLAIEQPPDPDRAFAPREPFVIDDLSLEVRHTPGHSPGSVTLIGGPGAFVGDTVFAGSIGRTDLPGGDTRTLLEAIVSQVLSLPAQTRLFPGHGPETTVAAEAATNPFLSGLLEPCQRCGTPLPHRLAGCKGGHCPGCGHPYPHGDCSD
ncbi:MAG: MBL fold metallo-hydrolase [Gemmatimonadetes bacterium]|nr:MBL fold metallo-hydrolase [Gemmatimonadota bacterium]